MQHVVKVELNYLFAERICMRVDENRELQCILQQGRAEIRDYCQKPSCNGRIVAGRRQYQRTLKAGLQRHPGGDSRPGGRMSLKFWRELGMRTSSINLIGA